MGLGMNLMGSRGLPWVRWSWLVVGGVVVGCHGWIRWWLGWLRWLLGLWLGRTEGLWILVVVCRSVMGLGMNLSGLGMEVW